MTAQHGVDGGFSDGMEGAARAQATLVDTETRTGLLRTRRIGAIVGLGMLTFLLFLILALVPRETLHRVDDLLPLFPISIAVCGWTAWRTSPRSERSARQDMGFFTAYITTVLLTVGCAVLITGRGLGTVMAALLPLAACLTWAAWSGRR